MVHQHYLTFNISPCLIREVRKKNDFFSKERKKQEPYPPEIHKPKVDVYTLI
jgi:hypothetical protein